VTNVFLYPSAPSPNDVILSDPTQPRNAGQLFFQAFTASMATFSGGLVKRTAKSLSAAMSVFVGSITQATVLAFIHESGGGFTPVVNIINNSFYPDSVRLSAAVALLLQRDVMKRNWFRDRMNPIDAMIGNNMGNDMGFRGYIERAKKLLYP
jgi:hypothetical protein